MLKGGRYRAVAHLPTSIIGWVIGHKGCNARMLKQQTGTELWVDVPGQVHRSTMHWFGLRLFYLFASHYAMGLLLYTRVCVVDVVLRRARFLRYPSNDFFHESLHLPSQSDAMTL